MRKAYTHHRHCCRTNFFQTALRNTFAGYHEQFSMQNDVSAENDVFVPRTGLRDWVGSDAFRCYGCGSGSSQAGARMGPPVASARRAGWRGSA